MESLPSILSSYQKEVVPTPSPDDSTFQAAGDGFTSSEVSATLHPLSCPWTPPREYEKCPIILLQTGPGNYQITGRIVNFSMSVGRGTGSSQRPSEGQCLLVVSDGTGAIAVKLCCFKQLDCNLVLGHRVTIFATYITDATKTKTGYLTSVTCATTLYPSRNGATHMIFHQDSPSSADDSSCRTPLGLNPKQGDYVPGLMTLKTFVAGGYDMGDGKILVCVRSIGPQKTVRPRNREGTVDLVEVGIFDDTATSVLTLWGDHVMSAKSFLPNQTILLITCPKCRVSDRPIDKSGVSAEVSIGLSSMVHVDPAFAEAYWLREKVKDLTTKESFLTRFPEEVWDDEASVNGPIKDLFTIAEVDELVRQDLSVNFTGKLNVVIIEMNLMESRRKGMVCFAECCGIALYANRPLGTCKNCGMQREFSLNPRIVGAMIDESGTLSAARLAWRDTAWTQLFFGAVEKPQRSDSDGDSDLIDQSWEDLTVLDTITVRDFEDQLLFSRMTLIFGWSSELMRLCVLGVEW
ncbi:hypothetical protein BJ170DRAFT_717027 [Xylariales sp. AK1849]|nr:hypothetical protein BJ170DRAFT_717027 [Xylariales sp. AK1849]